ncbi:MAG: hypothetical protein KJP21_03850, partial [Bacteroidia bacterium]|nr:hypothetical protein [Bacteroidia bacterium]
KKLTELKTDLYAYSPGDKDSDALKGIDHFHNQFHIQLVNVHDLKHELKQHRLMVGLPEGSFSPAAHVEMKKEVDFLTGYLDKLESEYQNFKRVHSQ